MDYLLKASGLVIILFLFYYIFLKNETFFKSIRSYFLIGLVIVVSIPLIEIPIYIENVATQLSAINLDEINSNQLNEVNSFDWIQILSFIYIIGVVIFSIKFLIQFISLGYLISKYKLTKQGEFYYVETSKNISPFSFFNIIVYNKSQFSAEELEQILNHEKVHVLQWHSLDTILAHLLVITLWFNPFVWLYKKAIQQNLEFLADADALKITKNQKLYQFTLLKTCNTNYCTEITNNFYNSLIKKRIVMLHKKQSKNISQWKYALLVPLLATFAFTFNTKVIAQEKEAWEIKVGNAEYVILIDKNSTNEFLSNEKVNLKKEFNLDFTYKGIKRNSKNEIIAIKIDVKGKDLKASYNTSGKKPINPIIISYNPSENSIKIGNLNNDTAQYSYITEQNELNNNVTAKDIEIIEVGNHKVKVLHENNEINMNENNTIGIVKKDGKNLYLIKNKDEKTTKFDDALYILDGKEISKENIDKLQPNSIEKIEVLKGDNATEKYGEKGKNGVIIITTKKE